MGAIASLSLNLTVNTSAWGVGLKKASDGVSKFGGFVESRLSGTAKAFAGLGQSASAGFAGIAKGAAQVAGGLALLDLAKLGLSTAIETTVGAVSAGIERIDQLTDAAGRIGVTTEALSSLRYAADLTGSSAADLDAALEKLNANLGDANLKATPAGDALTKLGLDAKELANDTPDVAFREIIHAFEKIPNAADKASLAMDVFGKGGMKLINTLSAGNSTIDELVDEANRLGVAVSQVDASRIGAAKDAMDRMGAAIQGVGNQAAIVLAPSIEVVAKEMTAFLGTTLQQAGGVESAVGKIAKMFGYVADQVQAIEYGIQKAFAFIIGAYAKLEALVKSFPGNEKFAKQDADWAKAFHEDIDRAFAVKPSEKIGKFLDDVKAKSDEFAKSSADNVRNNLGMASSMDGVGKSVGDLTKKLREQADTIGMTTAEADIYKLAMQGATEADLAEARAQAARIKAGEKAKKDKDDLENKAKDYVKNTRTADERAAFESAEIDKARDAGLLNDEQATRAKAKSRKDAGLDEVKFAGADDVRSSGGYSTIVAALSGRNSGMSELVKTNREQLKAGNSTVTILGKVFTVLNGKKDPEFINI